MSKIKVLELFGGIGALTKAFKRLGIPHHIADYVEIDKYAVASYNAIHGTNFEPQDICEWDKDIEVDLIMHGSPCQDFSLAGKQAGGDEGSGTRSSLMYETIRIVDKLKPKYVIWENVKNLLSKKHRHNFDAYLETMEQLGYINYYQVLNAKDYGIPQNRERVFTISILGNENYEFPKGNECENKIQVVGNYMPSGHDASRIVDENGLAPTVKENHGTVTAVLQRFEFPPKQELKLKLKDMLEDEVDEKYYLSEKMIKNISALGTKKFKNNNSKINLDVARPLTSTMSKMHRAGADNYLCDELPSNYDLNDINEPKILDDRDKGWGIKISDICPTQRATRSGIKVIEPKLLIKNNTKKGYLEAQEGDGVYTNTSTKRGTVQKEMIQTLTTFQDKGVVMNDLRIRKLTPKECWQLMGFDDEDFEKAEKVNSNTQLYKQAGNSIVVNVLEAILTNLLLEPVITNQEIIEGQTTIFDYIGDSNE